MTSDDADRGRHRFVRGRHRPAYVAAITAELPDAAVAVGATRPTEGLDAHERRSIVFSTIVRVAGTPVVALIGLLNTAIIVMQTGSAVFGVVTLISTITLLFPFADLGIGSVVTNVTANPAGLRTDQVAIATVQRAFRVLTLVSVGVIALALVVMAVDGWAAVIGLRTSDADRWVVTVAVCIFALSIPAGLGTRILVGIGRNDLAVLIMMSNSLFTLGVTGLMLLGDVRGILYCLPGLIGSLLGNTLATAIALRKAFGTTIFRRAVGVDTKAALLTGSVWMFVVSIGLPLGLQSQRIVLSHFSTPEELSRFALMAQIYAIGWSVFSTAGMAFWPVFVKRRDDPDATIQLWARATAAFTLVSVLAAIGMTALGPFAASVLSSGTIVVSTSLAFAFGLLIFAQCVHLPSGVLLTTPREMRWQAGCVTAMSILSIVAAVVVAPGYGAVGVVVAAALAVVAAQALPDLAWVPRLVQQRFVADWTNNQRDDASAAANR